MDYGVVFDYAVTLMTLVALEIILGVDNILMININAGSLPANQRKNARFIGMSGAMVMRAGMLCALSWVVALVDPVFTIFSHPVSWRDMILFGGGLFLVYKATHEIYSEVEGVDHRERKSGGAAKFVRVIAMIMLFDIVFSLDSVITAVGMAQSLAIMISAVVISMGVMMVFVGKIGEVLDRYHSIKVLALSFLVLIGVFLIIEGAGEHVEKGYVYVAMGFAFGVELLHIRKRSKASRRAVLRRREAEAKEAPDSTEAK